MKTELTKEENEFYTKIVKSGDIEDMFYYGYLIGRERMAKERLEAFDRIYNEKIK